MKSIDLSVTTRSPRRRLDPEGVDFPGLYIAFSITRRMFEPRKLDVVLTSDCSTAAIDLCSIADVVSGGLCVLAGMMWPISPRLNSQSLQFNAVSSFSKPQ